QHGPAKPLSWWWWTRSQALPSSRNDQVRHACVRARTVASSIVPLSRNVQFADFCATRTLQACVFSLFF
ncbi:unnamed protein product, partial [Ectocarpus sp. 13 AM-2016]